MRQGFEKMLRNDCQPLVVALTREEAEAFPHHDPAPPGAQWWMAVGLDVDRRGTWSTRWSFSTGLTDEEARELAELRLLEDLAGLCNVRGLPAEAAR